MYSFFTQISSNRATIQVSNFLDVQFGERVRIKRTSQKAPDFLMLVVHHGALAKFAVEDHAAQMHDAVDFVGKGGRRQPPIFLKVVAFTGFNVLPLDVNVLVTILSRILMKQSESVNNLMLYCGMIFTAETEA